MNLPVYRDIDGEIRQNSEWDMHHPFNRASMSGKGERQWADLFKIAMFKEHHNQGKNALHPNAPHLPKPGRNLAMVLRHYRYQQIKDTLKAPVDEPISAYDQLLDLNEFIHCVAEIPDNPGMQKEAKRIGNALEQQLPYILLGQVEVIPFDDSLLL